MAIAVRRVGFTRPWRAILLVACSLSLPAAAGLEVVTEYPIAGAGADPYWLAVGGEGNVWFTEYLAGRIGRITPAGVVAEFDIPSCSGCRPSNITLGPDGNMWFTQFGATRIGRITPAGVIDQFPAPDYTTGITTGPDGNLWFTEYLAGRVGVISPSGAYVAEYFMPAGPVQSGGVGGARPTAIVLGPDGNLWFTEHDANQIGRLTPAGVFTEFPIPTSGVHPYDITVGADGALWFGEFGGNRVGRITVGGIITEFPLSAGNTSNTYGVARGRNGVVWFAEQSGGKIGRITTGGRVTETTISASGSTPFAVAVDATGSVWFTDPGTGKIGRVTVPAADATTTTLSSSKPIALTTSPAIFTATVAAASGVPTGHVQFFDGLSVLGTAPIFTKAGNRIAVWGGADLTVAGSPHSITATYLGDGDFASSTTGASSQVVELGTYFLMDLGTLGGNSAQALAINDLGDVVGHSSTLHSSERHAFLYSGGALVDIGPPASSNSAASSLNSSTQVVGTATIGGTDYAFLYDRGSFADPGGPLGSASAISDSGYVVGTAYLSGGLHAFRFRQGTVVDLGTLGGSVSRALAVNDTGVVVGLSLIAGDSIGRAFRFTDDQMTDLGALDGTGSHALSVNEAGQAVGVSSFFGTFRAVLYEAGTASNLGTLGGPESRATAINAAGQVVGYSSVAAAEGGDNRAFLFDGVFMKNIGWPGAVSSFGIALNDAGQVAAIRGNRAFVHTAGSALDLGGLGGGFSQPSAINRLGQVCGWSTTPSSTTNAVLWTPVPVSSLVANQASGQQGGVATLAATLASRGLPVSGKSIAFTVNGGAVGSATTNASGVATLSGAGLAGIAAGDYPTGVGAQFGGDPTLGASSATAGLVVSTAVPPTATVSGGQTICAGGPDRLQVALTGSAPWSLTWSDGLTQGGLTSTPAVRVVSPSVTTTYTLTAVTDANGQGTTSGSATTTVNVCTNLAISASAPPSVIAGSTFVVTATVVNVGPSDSAATVAISPPPGFVWMANAGDCVTAFPCALASMPAGARRTIVATFLVADPFPGAPALVPVTLGVSASIRDTDASDDLGQAATMVLSRDGRITAVWSIDGRGPCRPYGALERSDDGSLSGTAFTGFSGWGGTFVFDPSRGIVLQEVFDGRGPTGARPLIGLTRAANDRLFGTAPEGASGFGAIFLFDPTEPANVSSHVFLGSDGWAPTGRLVSANDGLLYGTTFRGGASDMGTIFRLDPSTRAFATLYSFSGADGRNPHAGLIQGVDGYLYGTTSLGGAGDQGTVFRFDAAARAVLVLHSFSGPDGRQPNIGGLVQAADGSLYGTTLFGGASDAGTVFRIALPSVVLTTAHSFDGVDGREPHAKLIQAADGWLYGLASNGGASQTGTVFRINPATDAFQLVYSFFGGEGAFPRGALHESADGSMYGTTSFGGGPDNCGSVYRFVPPPLPVVATATVSGGGTICAGGSATIQAALAGAAPWSLTWSDGFTQSGVTVSPATRTVSPGSTTTYTLTAFSDASGPGSTSGTATVTVDGPMAVLPAALPSALKGSAYGQSFNASGALSAVTWSVTGSLPTGTTFNSSTATLSGTPTASGSFPITVRATDTNGCTGATTYTLLVCTPITVNPATLVAGSSGVALTRTLTAAGGTAPYAYALASGALPLGLTLSSAGIISGTALQTGTFTFTVTAADALGCTGSRAYTWTINCPTQTLNPATLAGITIGDPATRTLSVTNAAGAVTYALVAGALPTGLTLTGNQIAGTPTANGTYTFTIKATDAAGCTTSRAYTWVVSCPALTLNPASFADVPAGVALSRTLSLGGGPVLPVTYAVTAGALPAGLSIASNLITGTPIVTGTFTFTLGATDAVGCTTSRAYTWNVICPTITVNPATEAAATVGVALNRPLTTSGGVAPISLALSGAPAWLSLSGTALVGTPPAAGSVTFTVAATDANGCAGSRTYTLAVNCPAVTVTTATLARGLRAAPYSKALAAAGGRSPWTFAVSVGSLPPGLTLSASGFLSGTPTAGGSFPFTVVATDANGCSGAARALTLDVDWLVVNNLALGTATAGTAYSKTFTQTGGVPAISFSVSAGALPAGLTLAASGLLAGTPTQNGTFPFTVQATDSGGHSNTRAFSLTVGCFTFSPANGPLAGGTVGKPFSQTLTLNGGVGPVIFQTTAGTLPPGLSVSGNKLVGTPTATGTYSFTLTATDGSGCSVSHDYSVVVGCMTLNQTAVAGAITGKAYSQTFTVTGGTAPITFSESGALPPGLVWTPPNKLTGTPTAAPSSSAINVTATDAAGCSTSRLYTLNTACFTFTPAAGGLVPDATSGVPYTLTFNANGGVGTPSYAVTSGVLPPGLSLSGNQIVGTPDSAAAGVAYTFTVTGTDGAGCAPARTYTLTVNCASLSPATLPAASLGSFYNQTLTVVGGSSPTLSLSGPLPSGISFNPATGVLSGTPGQAGTFALTFTAADPSGCMNSEIYNFVVSCSSLTILPAAATITAASGTPFTALTFTTTGGIPPIAISIEGDLPNGMAAAGPALSGTPTEVGLFPIVVRAIDASGCQQTRSYTIQVN